MRLIDADWLIEVLNNRGYRIVSFYFGGVRKIFDTKEYIDKFPTINPEDLRPKGKWEPYYENIEVYNAGGYTERKQTGWICGKCKSKKSFTPHPTNFCPNCGAKMEE